MPAKRRKDGTFKDIAHPLNSETRERMERAILAEYEREVKKAPGARATGTDDE
jgi:stage V sporulation protein G